MKYKISYYILSLFSLFLMFYLWFIDSNFNLSITLFLMKQIIFFFVLVFPIGFFISSKIKLNSFLEYIFISLFNGIIVLSVSVFLFSEIMKFKITSIHIVIISIFLAILTFFLNKKDFYKKLFLLKISSTNIKEIILICLIVVICFYSYNLSYSAGKEFINSIIVWENNDLTTCWVNATMESLNYFNYIKSYHYIPYKKIYNFPANITFGNVAISVFFVEIFQLAGWRIIYVFSGIFIAIFLFYILKHLKFNIYLSFFISIICSLNPFFLNIETPDRNILAVLISIFLFYFIISKQTDDLLFGFLCSFLLTTGLRHLPIIISLTYLIIYLLNKKNIKTSIIHIIYGSIFPLSIILFHFYGSNFTGADFIEKHSFLNLIDFNYKGLLNYPFSDKLTRVPFYAYPVFINNILILLKLFGALFCSISILGFIELFKENKKIAVSLFIIILFIMLILGVQSDWLHKEKLYPLLTCFISLFIFFSFGMKSLFSLKKYKLSLISIIIIIFIIKLLSSSLINIKFNYDKRIYKYYSLPIETKNEYAQNRKYICNIPIFPDYSKPLWNIKIKNSFFSEFPFIYFKDYKKNKDKLFEINLFNDLIKYLSKTSNNSGRKILSVNINSTFEMNNILNNIKLKNHNAQKNTLISNKLYDLPLYSLKLTKFKNSHILELNRIYSTFINKKNLSNNKEFIISNNENFSIIRSTYFELKKKNNKPAKYLLKNDIYIFSIKNNILKLSEYINNYSAKTIKNYYE